MKKARSPLRAPPQGLRAEALFALCVRGPYPALWAVQLRLGGPVPSKPPADTTARTAGAASVSPGITMACPGLESIFCSGKVVVAESDQQRGSTCRTLRLSDSTWSSTSKSSEKFFALVAMPTSASCAQPASRVPAAFGARHGLRCLQKFAPESRAERDAVLETVFENRLEPLGDSGWFLRARTS